MTDNGNFISTVSEYFNEETVLKWMIYSQVIECVWDFYLSWRQHRVYQTKTTMPDDLIGIIDRGTYEKARVYALDKSTFELIQSVISAIITFLIIAKNGLFIMWSMGVSLLVSCGLDSTSSEHLQTVAFIFVMTSFNTVVKLPFNIYYTFVIEEKHGFNKQTLGFFVKDKLKSFVIGLIISAPIGCGLVYIVQNGGEYFFIYLWLFVMLVTFFLLTIYPEIIAPLFDKYKPLEEGELRVAIENLAAGIEFPLKKLYIVEGSKRSAHSNAYFYGFFKNKRIVLFDTLLKKDDADSKGKGCDNNEILAVVGHELGHWKLNHVLKNIIISQVNTFFIFLVFKTLFHHRPLYQAIGFQESRPVLVGLMAILQYVMSPYLTLVNCAMAQLSRRFEFAADQFAKSLGRSYALKAALIKLNADNLSFPIYDSWYSTWHNSHPPLLERLQALEKDD